MADPPGPFCLCLSHLQRPIIAAGIRGLVVLGGPYTGPSMNPMIAFGWALYNGAHKVRHRPDRHGANGPVRPLNDPSVCLPAPPHLCGRASTTTWCTGSPPPWAPCWPPCCSHWCGPRWSRRWRAARRTTRRQERETQKQRQPVSGRRYTPDSIARGRLGAAAHNLVWDWRKLH